MLQNIHPVVLVAFVVATGQLDPTRIGATSNFMPAFDDSTCPQDNGDLCVSVKYSNSIEDLMILTQVSGTHIYEGYLRDDKDVSAVLIDTPLTNKRVIAFNSEHVPNCSLFDLDTTNNQVKCIRATFNDQNTTNSFLGKTEAMPSFEGDIIHLGDDYPNGIDLKVLFYFDSHFYNEFNGEDGKSAEEHMMEAMSVVKLAYKDKSMKTEIGTHVNIIAEKKVYDGSFRIWEDLGSFFESSNDKNEHDAIAFVTSPGSSGSAWLGTVCRGDAWEDRSRYSINRAYGPNRCDIFNPPEPIECTPTNRVVLTAETIAHELGHNLGMAHDFDQKIYNSESRYVYRKYKGKDCRGLMDYIDDGVGWSQCSMMDFSRYITNGGTQKPCIGEISSTNSSQSPTNPATDRPSPSCLDDEIQCKSGECIPWQLKCDRKPDCEDGSDEGICPDPSCLEDGVRCRTGECIPWDAVCDRYPDCEDGSDEGPPWCFYGSPGQSPTNPATDRPSPSCLENETQCKSGECISSMYVCDGEKDCEDGSDENFLPCPSCPEAQCKSGSKCIQYSWQCDGFPDCNDGSDEDKQFCDDYLQY